jgi:hypothetical protein
MNSGSTSGDSSGQPSPHADMSQETHQERSLDAYVLEAGGDYNRYQWDAKRRVLVLTSVVHPAIHRGSDLAHIPFLPIPLPSSSLPAIVTQRRHRAAWIEEMEHAAELDQPNELVTAGPASLGPALLIFLLSDPPLPPGTRVAVRLLGALYLGNDNGPASETIAETVLFASARWLGIGVPADDPSLSQIRELSDLPLALEARLERAFALMHDQESMVNRETGMAAAGMRTVPRLTAAEVMALYRESRAEMRRNQRLAEEEQSHHLPQDRLFRSNDDRPGNQHGRKLAVQSGDLLTEEAGQGTAWRELAGVSPAERLVLGPLAYASGEHLLRWVPSRFERYLSELLLPEEQVLFFAECPTLTMRGWTGELLLATSGHDDEPDHVMPARSGLIGRTVDRMRTRRLQHGILLVTDYQMLLLRDYAPPDVTLVDWGYVAHSWPLGRLVGAAVVPSGVPLNEETLRRSGQLEEGMGSTGGLPREIVPWLAPVRSYDEVTVPERYARLILALEGAEGIELTGAAFPADQARVLERAAALLRGFLPRWNVPVGTAGSTGGSSSHEPGDTNQKSGIEPRRELASGDQRVRLVPDVEPWKPTAEEAAALAWLGEQVPPVLAEALAETSTHALAPDEVVLIQARTPASQARGAEQALLLTLTPERLLVARGHKRQAGLASELESYPLGEFSSIVLQHSVLSSGMVIHRPVSRRSLPRDQSRMQVAATATPISVEQRDISFAFPSPLIVPFRALFTRARVRLGISPRLGLPS